MDNVDSYVADPRNKLGVETPKLGIVYLYKEKKESILFIKIGSTIVIRIWEYESHGFPIWE